MSINPEFELIERIKRLVGPPPPGVLKGVGDDTAVVEPFQGKLLATVDALVEGVHFDLGYSLPEDVGHKALAVNLSDIAAMAGKPRYALVSLGLRDGLGASFIEGLYRGMTSLASRFGVTIIGGNLTRSPQQIFIDITVLGEADSPVTRDGSREGQIIALVGTIGDAAGGLAVMKRGGRAAQESYPRLVQAQLRPEPRCVEAIALARAGAVSAMVDISDGLVNELHHLAEASGLGMRIEESRLPVSLELKRAASELGAAPLDWGLQGGEDYALLLTLDEERLSAGQKALKDLGGPELVVIGTVIAPQTDQPVEMQTCSRGIVALRPEGWSHF